MLSRVANSIYWMCRYIERAENVARFISVNLNLLLDMPDEMGRQWEPLVMITGDQEFFDDKYDTFSKESVINFLTFDRLYLNSLSAAWGWPGKMRAPFGKLSARRCGSTSTPSILNSRLRAR